MSDFQQGPGWWLASDGKWYPPQSSPQQPLYQPAKPTNGCLKAFLIGLAVLFALGLIGAIAGAGDESSDDSSEPASRPSEERVDDREDSGDQADGSDRLTSSEGEGDEIDDVELAECTTEFGFLTATLNVTNNSRDRSSYFIDVVFENQAGNRQFGTGFASVSNLANGQTTTVDVGSLDEAPAEAFVCRVASVDRFAS